MRIQLRIDNLLFKGGLVLLCIAKKRHCTPEMQGLDIEHFRRASTSQSNTGDYLYEPAFGLPIVRRKVDYGELLREIRQNKVRHIAYFDNNTAPPENAAPSTQTNLELEGYCLVVYNDDSLAQVYHAHGRMVVSSKHLYREPEISHTSFISTAQCFHKTFREDYRCLWDEALPSLSCQQDEEKRL